MSAGEDRGKIQQEKRNKLVLEKSKDKYCTVRKKEYKRVMKAPIIKKIN